MPKPPSGSSVSLAAEPDCSTRSECGDRRDGGVERLHRVLEVAEVPERVRRSLIAHQPSQFAWQRAGDLDRASQVLVLLLPQPTKCVTDVDAEAVGVTAVGPAAVVHRPDIEQYRTLDHLRRDGLLDR